ncbi:MAG: hypothetical protein LBG64_02700 [Pseudomonadales bacterium]|jgi:hypothetical protein|nr:hypothetical protein [Pseudomonadales bacterium]
MFETSKTLFENGVFPSESPFFDKLFLLANKATVEKGDGIYRFIIDDKTPTVRLNNNVHLDVPTIKDIAVSNDYVLFSSNVILKIARHGYLVLERDDKAPTYPKHLTCPAGRCDQSPQKTAIAEVNQELDITIRRTGSSSVLLGFCVEEDFPTGNSYKQKASNGTLPEFVMIGNINWQKGPDKYEFIVGGQLIESGAAKIIYDAETNAYEICFVVEVELPEGWEVDSVVDGEDFGRKTYCYKSLKNLSGRLCVPALKAFIG